MRAQQVAQSGRQAVVVIAMALVVVLAVVMVVLIVGVPVVVAAGLRVAHDPRMPPEPCCSISTTACPTHLRQFRGERVK
jgi:type IV secretory pathway VirB3-like protein